MCNIRSIRLCNIAELSVILSLSNRNYHFDVAEERSWRTLTCCRARRGTGCSKMTFGEHHWRNVVLTVATDHSAWPPSVWIISWVALNPGAIIWWTWRCMPAAPFSWSGSPERWATTSTWSLRFHVIRNDYYRNWEISDSLTRKHMYGNVIRRFWTGFIRTAIIFTFNTYFARSNLFTLTFFIGFAWNKYLIRVSEFIFRYFTY